MVDDEECLVPGIMRDQRWTAATLVIVVKLYYIGRTDRQIKRNGIRMNLDHIQQVPYVYRLCVHDLCVFLR